MSTPRVLNLFCDVGVPTPRVLEGIMSASQYPCPPLEGLVPKCIDLERRNRKRNGRSFKLPILKRDASARLKSIREDSFFVHSVKLFNSLPREIRDLKGCKIEKFKRELDKFLLELPDAPLIPGYTASSLVGSNSIVDWCNWRKCVRDYVRWKVWDPPWPWVKTP